MGPAAMPPSGGNHVVSPKPAKSLPLTGSEDGLPALGSGKAVFSLADRNSSVLRNGLRVGSRRLGAQFKSERSFGCRTFTCALLDEIDRPRAARVAASRS